MSHKNKKPRNKKMPDLTAHLMGNSYVKEVTYGGRLKAATPIKCSPEATLLWRLLIFALSPHKKHYVPMGCYEGVRLSDESRQQVESLAKTIIESINPLLRHGERYRQELGI